MTDRDHFAAAALTGMLGSGDLVIDPRNGTATTLTVRDAYRWADAMLRERSPTGQKVAESDSLRAACTDHDAAPAARANAESVAPQPTAGDRSGNPTSHSGTGNTSDRSQPVKDDVFDRSKPISDERLAALEELSALDQELELKHGITGNPMIKAQPCKAADLEPTQPRNGALSGCETVPDPDSRVWETPCTPQPHATPPQGSAQGEGSFRDSRNANKPVAWWLKGSEYDTGCEYEYVSLVQESAEAAAKEGGTVTPLYAHPQPTLTDEERDAVERAIKTLDGWQQTGGYHSAIEDDADTLRKLLERLA